MKSAFWQGVLATYPHPGVIITEQGVIAEGNQAFTQLALTTQSILIAALSEAMRRENKACLLRTLHDETWLQWSISPFCCDDETAFVCLSQPVSALVQAVEHAKTLQSRIIDLLPNHIFWKDKHSVYLGCNQAFAKELGLESPQAIIGKTDYDLPTTYEQSEAYRADDKAVMQSKRPRLGIEERQTRADGSEHTLLTSKIPLFNERQEVTGVLAIYTDITEQKHLEESLRQAKDEAEVANQAKTAFIANMSHDIRTPLAGIIGMADLLKNEGLSPDAHQKAQWLLESGEQLLGLLNDVLALIAADFQAENQVNYQWFDLKACLHNLIALEMPAMRVKELTFQLNMDASVPTMIYTDKMKLHRLLLNLLSNAVKFTEKGVIAVDVHAFKKHQAIYQFVFRVKDTGCGIPENHLKKIFDRFYRITPSYKGVHDGYGIGLHVVKQYCEALGGELDVESQENCGSTFTVTIPAKVKDVLPIEPVKTLPANLSPQAASSIKILLVEDNIIALRTLETLVKQYPSDYESATTGLEALELASQHPFDLILTDIGLPDISGIELTKRWRLLERQQQKPPLPIIGLTAHAQNDIAAEAIAAGMQSVFTKPITVNLLQEIMAWVPSSHMAHTIRAAAAEAIQIPPTEKKITQDLEVCPVLDERVGIAQAGSYAMWLELLEVFAQQLTQERMLLQTYYEKNDWQAIAALAHKLKSSTLYCGALKLKKACLMLEPAANETHNMSREEHYHKLLKTMDETQAMIGEQLKVNNGPN